jgi:hypothetical protein
VQLHGPRGVVVSRTRPRRGGEHQRHCRA